jgi:hypothetical protein
VGRVGRSRVRFQYEENDLIVEAEKWLLSRLSLQQKWVPGIFTEVKGGRHVRLTTSPPSVIRFFVTL